MAGVFITFEGTEGAGKSTQIKILADRLKGLGQSVRLVREPGSTPIGEEIRHTLQHSREGEGMTPETELLLMNASRAQLVREVIRPALNAGEIVLCDRFYDSTVAYQGYGRGLDLELVQAVIDFAVGQTRPDLTLMLHVPLKVSFERQKHREPDRFEKAGRPFFEKVEQGFRSIAKNEPDRVKWIDAAETVAVVSEKIWQEVQALLA